MGRSLVFSTNIPLKFSQAPRSIAPRILPIMYQDKFIANSSFGYQKIEILNKNSTRNLCIRASISEISNQRRYPKVGAKSTGPIPPSQLIEVVETAARTGAEVVIEAVNKPRNITYKGLTDLVTDTDKVSELAILDVVKKNFGDHLILGEEGGIIGDTSSDYLWCIDPLDGTTNFAHCYPSFAVSVGVLFQGHPAAASVGVRRLGAAAVGMCHVALGVAEAYWEYCLKPWDMAAGVLIVEEAGGAVTRMDGECKPQTDAGNPIRSGKCHIRATGATHCKNSGKFKTFI
ncbi:Phosphatase IMPL1 [Hibiscus syriacus]|uniref:Phosphatase IMPL1 n=1 Tax=Hibiscus syriacus TaxID=106335 RepID=A0A6A3BEB3_HIBSY|nr:Phosphatase IMPL1 [Hibiscus syriacus]